MFSLFDIYQFESIVRFENGLLGNCLLLCLDTFKSSGQGSIQVYIYIYMISQISSN